MARENNTGLFLTVPSFFKCPISMDVMKSPVSLTTGVTYDRTSIQKWLDSGHNTCPATMQILQSTDVVPNLTLRRLIRVWSDSYLVPPESHALINHNLDSSFLKKLISNEQPENLSSASLSRIITFAKSSPENKDSLAKFDGFVSLMIKMLINNNGVHSIDSVEVLEQVIICLELILHEKDVKELLAVKLILDVNYFSSFVIILQRGGFEARISAARVLEALSSFDDKLNRIIADQSVIIKELYRLATSESSDSIVREAGFGALIAVSTSRQSKKEIVRLGIVKSAGKILSGTENSVKLVEKVMKILEMVSTCTEGRTAICEDEKCVTAIVSRLMKVSTTATEHAIGVIWSVCYMSRDRTAQEAAMRNNGLTKVLLVMQSNCSGSVRKMCGELMRVFRVNSKSCLANYETRTSHIMPY